MDTHTCVQRQVKGGGKSHFYLPFFYNPLGRVRVSFCLLCFGMCCQLLLEKAMAPHSSTPAWKNPMDRVAWKAAVHGVAEGRTRLSDFTFTFHFHALEKEMATHSSVLA